MFKERDLLLSSILPGRLGREAAERWHDREYDAVMRQVELERDILTKGDPSEIVERQSEIVERQWDAYERRTDNGSWLRETLDQEVLCLGGDPKYNDGVQFKFGQLTVGIEESINEQKRRGLTHPRDPIHQKYIIDSELGFVITLPKVFFWGTSLEQFPGADVRIAVGNMGNQPPALPETYSAVFNYADARRRLILPGSPKRNIFTRRDLMPIPPKL